MTMLEAFVMRLVFFAAVVVLLLDLTVWRPF